MSGMSDDRLWRALRHEIARQDGIHAPGYQPTRDGVRLGLASMEDELRESLDEWRHDRAGGHYAATAAEVLQTVAVGMRLLRMLVAHGTYLDDGSG